MIATVFFMIAVLFFTVYKFSDLKPAKPLGWFYVVAALVTYFMESMTYA